MGPGGAAGFEAGFAAGLALLLELFTILRRWLRTTSRRHRLGATARGRLPSVASVAAALTPQSRQTCRSCPALVDSLARANDVHKLLRVLGLTLALTVCRSGQLCAQVRICWRKLAVRDDNLARCGEGQRPGGGYAAARIKGASDPAEPERIGRPTGSGAPGELEFKSQLRIRTNP